MRITTNMVMRNYNNNLSNALNGLEQARSQVQTGRRFAKSYEDPMAAAKGLVLDSRYARNADYLDAVDETQKWQDTQEDVLMQMNSMAQEINKKYDVEAMNDASGKEGRAAYASALRELQKSMVYALNTKYGNSYVMAGNDGSNAPFKLHDDGTLTYRGLDVNDPANSAVMEELSKETAYVDLGFGLNFDAAGQIVSSSAFDSAFPGINAVGFGQTDDGTSKNLIVLAGQMADLLEADDFSKEAYGKLWDQFNEGSNRLQDSFATLGTKTKLLEATKDRLENEKLNITKQYDAAINIDPAEAIMNYSWAQYVYNSCLKMGTSIISPSLLDFMK